MSDNYFLVFGIICAVIGFLCVFMRLFATIKTKQKVISTIVSVKQDYVLVRGSKVWSYSPVVNYIVDGMQYTGEVPVTSRKKDRFRPGDPFEIYVNPKNPEMFTVRGKPLGLIFGLLLFGVGVLFIVLRFIS